MFNKPTVVTVLWLSTALSFAQVDPSFSPTVTGQASFFSAAFQKDGKVLVAGRITHVGRNLVAPIVRFNSNGSLDNSFRPPAFLMQTEIYSVAVDGQGKILVGGYTEKRTPLLVRLHTDGSEDLSFRSPSEISGMVAKILPISQDRYLVASLSTGNRWLARLKLNGEIDGSFDPGATPDNWGSMGFDMAQQLDGKIVLSGLFTKVNNTPANRVVRLNTDGTIDKSLVMGSGAARAGYLEISSVLTQGNSFFLAGNFTTFNNLPVGGVIKILESGNVDPAFQPAPALANVFPFGINSSVLSSEGLLVAGYRFGLNSWEYVVLRLTFGGAIDTSFQELIIPITESGGISLPPVLKEFNSNILFCGHYNQIAAIRSRGVSMLTSTGLVKDGFSPEVGVIASVKVVRKQSDGKVLLGGDFTHVNGKDISKLARLNRDGSLDDTFQNKRFGGEISQVTALELTPTGQIYVGGSFSEVDGNPRPLLVRLNTNGSVDPTFDHRLWQPTSLASVYKLLVDSNGKLIVAGTFSHRTDPSVKNVVRLNSDGSIDQNFSKIGFTEKDYVYGVGLQSNGRLVMAGLRTDEFNRKGLVKIVDAAGNLIKDVWPDNTSNSATELYDVEVLPDDQFLAGGYTFTLNSSPIFRFDKDGNLTDSQSIVLYGGAVTDISVVDNSIWIAGSFRRINQIDATAIAATDLKGVIDLSRTYGVVARGADFATVHSIAISPGDSQILIGGFFSFVLGAPHSAVARIDLRVPLPAANLTAVADEKLPEILLKWKDNSSFETGFRISRSEGADYQFLATLPAQQESFTDKAALPKKAYSYRVVCLNGGFESVPSNDAMVSTNHWVPPKPPTGFSGTHSFESGEVKLTWKDESDNEDAFFLERAEGDQSFIDLKRMSANTTAFTDPILFDKKIRYRLRASNAFGDSERLEFAELPVVTEVDPQKQSFLQVYPNPTSGRFWIGNETEIELVVDVYNSAGDRLVHSKSREQAIPVDISGYSGGLFMLFVFNGRQTRSIKIVKKH